jgi:hypothetical protein
MEDDASSVTTDAFPSSWLRPYDALMLVSKSIGTKEGRIALLERLRGGMIRAIASTSSVTADKGEPVTTLTPTLIPAGHWSRFSSTTSTTFWHTGTARFFFPGDRNRRSRAVQCFDIKLDPAGIRALLSSIPAKTNTPPAQPPAPSATPPIEAAESNEVVVPKGPAVSSADLKTWFDLYRRVYKGKDDTEANAFASAVGMFPGRTVSRQRVRDLRGEQKRGRKKQDGELTGQDGEKK